MFINHGGIKNNIITVELLTKQCPGHHVVIFKLQGHWFKQLIGIYILETQGPVSVLQKYTMNIC